AAYAPRPKRWAFGTYFAGVQGLTTHGEMHLRPDGYIGVAPLPGDVANVCVVRELRNMFRAQRVHAERIVEVTVREDADLRERFARAEQISAVTSLGPLAVDCGAAGYPGLLLAGDARAGHRRRRLHEPAGGSGQRVRLEVASQPRSSRARRLAAITGRCGRR